MSKIHPAYSCDYDDDEESQQRHEDGDKKVTVLVQSAELYNASNLMNKFEQMWTDLKLAFLSTCTPTSPATPDVVKSRRKQNFILAFQKYKKGLLLLSNIAGSSFFSAGSIVGYGFSYGYSPSSCGLVTCQFFQSIVSVVGAIFFTLTPAATHFLNEVDKEEVGDGMNSLSWKSNLYIIGGIIYILGAIAYVPFSFTSNTQHSVVIGATLYLIGSVIYVIAVIRDMYRARKLKDKSRLCFINFMIESWVSGLYLFGSCMFLMGSVFSFPSLFTPHIYAMFLTGSICFIIGSISGFSAQLWRYAQRALQRERILKHRKAVMTSLRRTTSNLQEALITRSQSSPNLMRVARQLSFTKTPGLLVRQLSFTTTTTTASSGLVLRQPSFNTFSRLARHLSSSKLSDNSNNLNVKPQVITKSKLKPTQIAVEACHPMKEQEEERKEDYECN